MMGEYATACLKLCNVNGTDGKITRLCTIAQIKNLSRVADKYSIKPPILLIFLATYQ